jgi:hypothetical protein
MRVKRGPPVAWSTGSYQVGPRSEGASAGLAVARTRPREFKHFLAAPPASRSVLKPFAE